jgi:hypothetical protein
VKRADFKTILLATTGILVATLLPGTAQAKPSHIAHATSQSAQKAAAPVWLQFLQQFKLGSKTVAQTASSTPSDSSRAATGTRVHARWAPTTNAQADRNVHILFKNGNAEDKFTAVTASMPKDFNGARIASSNQNPTQLDAKKHTIENGFLIDESTGYRATKINGSMTDDTAISMDITAPPGKKLDKKLADKAEANIIAGLKNIDAKLQAFAKDGIVSYATIQHAPEPTRSAAPVASTQLTDRSGLPDLTNATQQALANTAAARAQDALTAPVAVEANSSASQPTVILPRAEASAPATQEVTDVVQYPVTVGKRADREAAKVQRTADVATPASVAISPGQAWDFYAKKFASAQEALQGLTQQAGAKMGELTANVSDRLQAASSSIQSTTSNLGEAVRASSANVSIRIDQTTAGISDSVQTAKSWIGNRALSFSEYAQEQASEVGSAANEMLSTGTGGLKNATSSVMDWVSGFPEYFQQQARALYTIEPVAQTNDAVASTATLPTEKIESDRLASTVPTAASPARYDAQGSRIVTTEKILLSPENQSVAEPTLSPPPATSEPVVARPVEPKAAGKPALKRRVSANEAAKASAAIAAIDSAVNDGDKGGPLPSLAYAAEPAVPQALNKTTNPNETTAQDQAFRQLVADIKQSMKKISVVPHTSIMAAKDKELDNFVKRENNPVSVGVSQPFAATPETAMKLRHIQLTAFAERIFSEIPSLQDASLAKTNASAVMVQPSSNTLTQADLNIGKESPAAKFKRAASVTREHFGSICHQIMKEVTAKYADTTIYDAAYAAPPRDDQSINADCSAGYTKLTLTSATQRFVSNHTHHTASASHAKRNARTAVSNIAPALEQAPTLPAKILSLTASGRRAQDHKPG